MENKDNVSENNFAELAYRSSYFPILGILAFMIFGFVAFIQMGIKGDTGFRYLKKGTLVCFINFVLLVSLIFIVDTKESHHTNIDYILWKWGAGEYDHQTVMKFINVDPFFYKSLAGIDDPGHVE